MKYILISLLIVSFSIQAQEFDYEDVSIAELEEQYHPLDSVAPAATLYERGFLDFTFRDGWKYQLNVTKRVKIYNSDGYDYATIKIPYYVGSSSNNSEKISNLKAYVYNLEDGKIVDERIRKRDIIDEEVTEFRNQIKFTFPNLKPGTIIEFSYTKTSPNIAELPEWYFQDDIPTNYSEFELVVLEYFGYNERAKGFHFINREIENTSTKVDLSLSNTVERTESATTEKPAIRKIYKARDIPKLKDEPFVNNHRNFLTSIGHELSYYRNFDTNTVKEFSTSWEDVSKTLQDSKSFGYELDKNKYYKDDIDNVLSESSSDTEKINNILNFVKNKIKWNEYNSIYCSEKLKKIYEERTGNVADINLMLTSMLRYAGFEANPVLVSTISNGIPRFTASTTDFNYVVAGVELGNETTILLDASNPYTSINILPTKCINWYGRLVRPNGTSMQIDLYPKEKSKDNFMMNVKLSEDGSLTGKMRRQFTDQYAFRYRSNFIGVDEKEYIEKAGNNFGVNITEYENENLDILSKPVVETFSFEKEDAVDIINDNIYMSPLLFLAQKENPFKMEQKERKLPINFTFPKSQRYLINIDIPEGYKIDYIPEPTAIALPNNKAIYRFSINESPTGDLQIVVNQEINQSILDSEYYLSLKDYFKNIVNKETDKIVLVKI